MVDKQETTVTITVPRWFELFLQYFVAALLGFSVSVILGEGVRVGLLFAVGFMLVLAGFRLVVFAWNNAMEGLAIFLNKVGFKGKRKE